MSDNSMHWRNKSVLSVTIISWMGTVERLVFLDFNIHLESPNTGNITPLQCNECGYVPDDNEDLESGETRTIKISDQQWACNTKKGTTAHKRLSLLLHYCIYYSSQLSVGATISRDGAKRGRKLGYRSSTTASEVRLS